MAEGNKSKALKQSAIVALVCILGAGLAIGIMNYKSSKLVEQLNKEITVSNEQYSQAVLKTNQLEEKIHQLQHKLATLKNADDIAKRDLEAYIKHRYRTVPKIVAKEVARQTVKLTKENGVPFSLIVGIIEVESQFKPWLISKKGARGLMQVMPAWLKNTKVKFEAKTKYDLHDIAANIKAGIKIYKYHLKEAKNDINQALYLYVGKDKTYADKVFNSMGRFEAFRSTLDDFTTGNKIEPTKGK